MQHVWDAVVVHARGGASRRSRPTPFPCVFLVCIYWDGYSGELCNCVELQRICMELGLDNGAFVRGYASLSRCHLSRAYVMILSST